LVVFDTEHLSSLFERVIIASGSSNRQTKALAASVRDKVRNAGFGKPRIEGEDNGEWIIVDCGPVVAHIMQPNIRQYYHLEEIWGEKPVRLKFGAPKPAAPKPKAVEKKPAAKKAAAKKAPAKSASAKSASKPAAKSTTKPAAKKAASSSKPVAKKAAPKKPKA
jgi:ribosome-associated protein